MLAHGKHTLFISIFEPLLHHIHTCSMNSDQQIFALSIVLYSSIEGLLDHNDQTFFGYFEHLNENIILQIYCTPTKINRQV